MSNRGPIMALFALIAALAAVHVLLSFNGVTPVRKAVSAGDVIWGAVAGMPAEDALGRIAIRRAGAPETVLERTSSWRLSAPYRASVEPQVVNRFLDALRFATAVEALPDGDLMKLGRTHGDFALSEPRLGVTLSDGAHEVTVSFGDRTPSGDGVYAELKDVGMVFVVTSNLFAEVDLDADRFRRRTLFTVGEESVTGFDVRQGGGSFLRFVRKGDGWKMSAPDEAMAVDAKVGELLGALTAAEAVGFVWPVGGTNEAGAVSAALLAGYGLDSESSVSLTLKCLDGIDRQVSFGKEAGPGLVFALAQGGGAVVTVPSSLRDLCTAAPGSFTDTRLFPYEESLVTSISVLDGSVKCLVAKGADGVWRIESPVVAPADAAAVEGLVRRLLTVRSDSLDPDGVKVSLSTNAEPVGVARAAAFGGLRLEDLRAREILRIDPASVKRLVVTDTKAKSTTAVVYDRDRMAWNVESSPVAGVAAVAGIEEVLRQLDPLVAAGVVKLGVSASEVREYGLESPRYVVAVDQDRADSVRRNLLVGDRTDGGFFATVGSNDAVFVLPEDALRRLLRPIVGD